MQGPKKESVGRAKVKKESGAEPALHVVYASHSQPAQLWPFHFKCSENTILNGVGEAINLYYTGHGQRGKVNCGKELEMII